MPRQRRKPAYWLHKPTGQARARINGKDYYLGQYGSAESQDEYERLVGQWFRGQDHEAHRLTIDDLALLHIDHADQYYRKGGQPTGKAKNIRYALRYAIRLFGAGRVADFGPLRLKAARQAMIEHGLTRKRINRDVARIFPTIAPELIGEISLVCLCATITRQSNVFLWPVNLPDPTGRKNAWNESAAAAAQAAESRWIRVASNRQSGFYEVFQPLAELSDPEWPEDVTFRNLLRLAFHDRIIDEFDHPILEALRGAA